MNVGLWLKKARQKIDLLDAELLLKHVLNLNDRVEIVAHPETELTEFQTLVLDRMLMIRQTEVPMAYILNEKEFYGRSFHVERSVLIPRPESEDIIGLAKEIEPEPKKILDVGTGSGVLAITLALEFPRAKVSACDISHEALLVATDNMLTYNVRIDFLISNLLDAYPKREKFDLIVANLPYVDPSWSWQSSELAFEPSIALYAKDGGMEIIKKFLRQAKKRAKYIILECDPIQQGVLVEFAKNLGYRFVKSRGFQLVFRGVI